MGGVAVVTDGTGTRCGGQGQHRSGTAASSGGAAAVRAA